jgi:hypothetical protein
MATLLVFGAIQEIFTNIVSVVSVGALGVSGS